MRFQTSIFDSTNRAERKVKCSTIEDDEVVMILDDKDYGYDHYSPDYCIPEVISYDGVDYKVTSLDIRCPNNFHITIEDSIKTIAINRPIASGGYSEESYIILRNSLNDYFCKSANSLFSNDLKTLHFIHRERDEKDLVLYEEIEHIAPGAISIGERIDSITIPIGVHELVNNAILGTIDKIIFEGSLQHLDKGALQKIHCKTIKINGLLSDLDNEGLDEIKDWLEKGISRNVIFAAPQPCGRGIIGNGFIELSEVLSLKDKLALGADTRPICINADINKGVVIQDGNEMEINNVPIIINKDQTTTEKTFNPVDITEIRFATNKEIFLYVHEDYETVEKLIRQSYNGIK